MKFRDSEVRQWLSKVNDKVLALETEAAGFAQQFYESDLRVGEHASDYLVIRGISDHADVEKNDKWRVPATANAMRALKALLALIPSSRIG